MRKLFNKNIEKLKTYVNELLRSIFNNFDAMPLGLRLLCKLVSTLAKQKVMIDFMCRLTPFSSQTCPEKSTMAY